MGHTVIAYGNEHIVLGNTALGFILDVVTKQIESDQEASRLLAPMLLDWNAQRDSLAHLGIFDERLDRHLAGDPAKVAALRNALCRVADDIEHSEGQIPGLPPVHCRKVVKALNEWIELLKQ